MGGLRCKVTRRYKTKDDKLFKVVVQDCDEIHVTGKTLTVFYDGNVVKEDLLDEVDEVVFSTQFGRELSKIRYQEDVKDGKIVDNIKLVEAHD